MHPHTMACAHTTLWSFPIHAVGHLHSPSLAAHHCPCQHHTLCHCALCMQPHALPAPHPAPSHIAHTLVHAMCLLCHLSLAACPCLHLCKLSPPSHPHDRLHLSSHAQTPFEHTIFVSIYTPRREWYHLSVVCS